MSAPAPQPGPGDRLDGLGDRATRLVASIVSSVSSLTDPGHPVDAALDTAFAATLDTYREAVAIASTTERGDVRNAAARGTADAALDGLDILAEAYASRAAGGPAAADLRELLDTEVRTLSAVDHGALLAERGYSDVAVSPTVQQSLAAADATNYVHVALDIRDKLSVISAATHAPIPVVSTDDDARVVAEHAAAGPFLAVGGTAADRPAAAPVGQAQGRPVGRTFAAGTPVGIDPKGWTR